MATSVNPATAGADQNPKKNHRRNVIMLIILIVAIIGGCIWLFQWWTVGRFIESTNDAYLRADSVTIAPKVSGYVTAVYVGDNQAVKAGQPLVKLDTRQYQAALSQSQADADARRADIAKARADLVQQQASIDQAKAQAEASRINAEHAASEYTRYAPLAATGAETGQKLADLRSTRDQTRATYLSNLAAVKSAVAQLTTLNAQIAQAQAQLEASTASAQKSDLDLNDTVVRSALDGNVGDRTVRVGQYVQPGTQMMTIVPVKDVYLVANFKETQVGDMRIGQPATLHVDALPGQKLHGVVDSFSPGTGSQFALLPPENATGNFTKIVQRVPVRIRLDSNEKANNLMLPGMSVTVDVDTHAAGSSSTGAASAPNAPAISDASDASAAPNTPASSPSSSSPTSQSAANHG